MANKSLQHSSLTDNIFYRSMLAGNDAYNPEFESDDFLEQVVLSTTASSVTFSSLGTYATAGYKHLQIRYLARATAGTWIDLWVRLNGSSSAEYARHQLRGTGSAVNSESTTSQTQIHIGQAAQTATTQAFYPGVIDALDFSSSSKNTTLKALSGYTADGYDDVRLVSGLWNNTSAVTSIQILTQSQSLAAGSRFSLYGSKG